MHRFTRGGALALALAVTMAAGCARARSAPGGEARTGAAEAWVGTWGGAPQLTEPRNMPPAPGLRGSTLRQVVHVSLGGTRLRVRVSNAFGDGPVTLGAMRVAGSHGAGALVPGTSRAITFAGAPHVTIPAGEEALSDPVAFDLAPLSDVAVSLYATEVPDGLTGHPGSRTTSYLQAGQHVDAAAMPEAVRTEHWYLLSRIDVVAPGGRAVVVLGNSIADGRGSGTDRQNRWPDNLARRLQADPRTSGVAVVNHGIGGNCLLGACNGPPGMERLERDVFGVRGARWLIVSEGVNDIGNARSPEASVAVARALCDAYGRLAERARAHGVRAYGATILPFGGSQYDSPEHEAARQAVNACIRTGGAFDAVIDLDAATRDPVHPARLRPDVDGGDHLHPNEQGYRVMADAIDLALFTR